MPDPVADSVVRIERGQVDPDELAVLTVLLLARISAAADFAPRLVRLRQVASWHRPDHRQCYRSARSWQS